MRQTQVQISKIAEAFFVEQHKPDVLERNFVRTTQTSNLFKDDSHSWVTVLGHMQATTRPQSTMNGLGERGHHPGKAHNGRSYCHGSVCNAPQVRCRRLVRRAALQAACARFRPPASLGPWLDHI